MAASVSLQLLIDYATFMRDLGTLSVEADGVILQQLKARCANLAKAFESFHLMSAAKLMVTLEANLMWVRREEGVYVLSDDRQSSINHKYVRWRSGDFVSEQWDRIRFQANLRRVVPELDLRAHLASIQREMAASQTIGRESNILLRHTVEDVTLNFGLRTEWSHIEPLWLALSGQEDKPVHGVFAYLPPPLKLDQKQRIRAFLEQMGKMVGCYVLTKPVVSKAKQKQRLSVCKLMPNSCYPGWQETPTSYYPFYTADCGVPPVQQARNSIYSLVALGTTNAKVKEALERRTPNRGVWDYRNSLDVLLKNSEVRGLVNETPVCTLPSQQNRVEDINAPRCNSGAEVDEQGYASPLSLAPNQCYHAIGNPNEITSTLFMADIVVNYGRGLSSANLQPKPNDALPDEVTVITDGEDDKDDGDDDKDDDDHHENQTCGWQAHQIGITAGLVLAAVAGTTAINRLN